LSVGGPTGIVAPALFALALLAPASGVRDPGDLDPAFGSGGIVVTDVTGDDDFGNAMAVQPDGRIVVVGSVRDADGLFYDFGVVRYHPDGTLDTTFGEDGIVVTRLTGDYDFANAVVIQPEGRILVAGQWGADPNGFALVRYLPDGSLDAAFGDDGIVLSELGNENTGANAVISLPDGTIVAAGYSQHFAEFLPDALAVAWYGPDGRLLRYRVDGVGREYGSIQGITRVPGRHLVGGGRPGFTLVRYVGGHLDPTFGDGGLVTRWPGRPARAWALVLQRDGKIVLAGDATRTSTGFALVRFTPSGQTDPTFGGDGIVTTGIGDYASATGVLVQPDGRIVATGWTDMSGARFALARYSRDGRLDAGFGTGGIVTTAIGQSAVSNASSLDRDGKILLVGQTASSGTYDLAVARYLTE
jgi:uncharacterized delta-60 repeat protein